MIIKALKNDLVFWLGFDLSCRERTPKEELNHEIPKTSIRHARYPLAVDLFFYAGRLRC